MSNTICLITCTGKPNIRLSPQSFSLTVFPQPSLQIEQFKTDPALSGVRLSIEKIKFSAQLKALFSGRLILNPIVLTRPVVEVIPSKANKKKGALNEQLNQAKASFTSLFQFLPDDQPALEIAFKELSLIQPSVSGVSGSIYLDRKKQIILFNAKIRQISIDDHLLKNTKIYESLDIGAFSLYETTALLKIDDQLSLSGQFNIDHSKLWSQTKKLLIETETIKSDVQFSEAYVQVDISPIQFMTPQAEISANFYHDFKLKNASASFSGANIDVKKADATSAILFKGHQLPSQIFDIVKQGVVPRIDVSFKANNLKTLFHDTNLFLDGSLKDGTVHIPETTLTAQNLKGQVQIRDRKLRIQSDQGFISNNRLKSAELEVDLSVKQKAPFSGTFMVDTDLSSIPGILISLLPPSGFTKELVNLSNIKGRTDARLFLKSHTDGSPLEVAVLTDPFTMNGNYSRIPGDISIDNVRFEFKNNIITLENLIASVNQNTLKDVSATIDLNRDFLDLRGESALINVNRTIQWLKAFEATRKLILPVVHGSGNLLLSHLDIKGPPLKPELWDYHLKGTGINVALTADTKAEQIGDFNFNFNANPEIFTLNEGDLNLENLDFIKSSVDPKQYRSIALPVSIQELSLVNQKGKTALSGTARFSEATRIKLELSGRNINALKMNTAHFIDAGSSDCKLTQKSADNSVVWDFSGILNFDSLKKIIHPDSYYDRKIAEITNNQPLVMHTDTNDDLHVLTSSLNIDSFFSTTADNQDSSNWLVNRLIYLKSNEIYYKALKFDNVTSQLKLTGKGHEIQINSADLCDLTLNGTIFIAKEQVRIQLPVKAVEKESISDLIRCLIKKEGFMEGNYSVRSELNSTGTPSDFIRHFNGPLDYSSTDGRIYKLTLLSRILSVLNVSKVFRGKIPDIGQSGFAYKSIHIESDIKDSIIHIDKAIVDGHDMTLILRGWIDPINDKIELTCLVAPFKTIDMIIEKIPVINTILNNRLVSVPVQATGKLSDPVVVPLHPSAVGSGIVNLMTDILKTPIKLLDKLPFESSDDNPAKSSETDQKEESDPAVE
jgi:hypothetical protein